MLEIKHGSGKFARRMDQVEEAAIALLKENMERLSRYQVWLSAGTLLGLYRDDGFIPHDTDLDVGFLTDWDDSISFGDIKKLFNDHQIVRIVFYDDKLMQFAAAKNNVLFDIYFFYQGREKEIAINFNDNGIMRKPLKFVQELGSIEFRGQTFPTPSPIEEYLEYRYADWKTPTDSKGSWVEDAPKGLLK